MSNHVSQSFRRKVERHQVTVAEWVILRSLFDGDGVKPSAVSEQIGLSRGAVSKLLDRLARKELVSIEEDSLDRRAQIVALTREGRRLVPRLAALADENDEETFGLLNAEERTALLELLKTITRRLDLRGAPVE